MIFFKYGIVAAAVNNSTNSSFINQFLQELYKLVCACDLPFFRLLIVIPQKIGQD